MMENFWDSNVWSFILILGVLLASLLLANVLKRKIPLLQKSMIPTSVLGGTLILLAEGLFKLISGGAPLFDANIFGENAISTLEIITYHCLALGFIASTLKTSDAKMTKQRTTEIFNTGVTTVATYLLQGVFGFAITMIACLFIKDFFPAAGVLLPFGYGQGTGQALNYGGIYEGLGFVGGKSFGLTIAALGFLSAAIGGVIHLNILRKGKKLKLEEAKEHVLRPEDVEAADEIPMQENMDKITVQIALILVSYIVAYIIMVLLGSLLPGMKAVVYGFNFLLGVLAAVLVKTVIKLLRKGGFMHRCYTSNFLLTRISNFFFDLMVVAGVAAIRLDALENYWGVVLILGVVGMVITYIYTHFIAKKLFPDYPEEQFLMTYGMLTGTASTGTILLREIDPDFKTPAADNMVYQNFPAIVFGFPMMLLATLAPQKPGLTMVILVLFFLAMNVILFRSFIFKKRK